MKQPYKVILEVDELKQNVKNEIELGELLEYLFEYVEGLNVLNITKLEKNKQYNYICFVDEDVDFLVTDFKGNEVYNKFRVWDKSRIYNEIKELFKNNVKFIDISKSDITKKDLPEWCRGIRARYYAEVYFKNV